MEWYWYLLIGVLLVGLIAFKMWYVPKWLKKQADKKEAKAKLMEDDD